MILKRHPRVQKLPLQVVLVVPFVLQLLATVGLVGYLSYSSGQRAIADLADQLMQQAGHRVLEYLETYLATPPLINRLNADAVVLGEIDPQNSTQLHPFLFRRLQQFPQVASVLFGRPNGTLDGFHRDITAGGALQKVVADLENPQEIRVYPLNEMGQSVGLPQTVTPFRLDERPWYKAAVESDQMGWSDIFQLGQYPSLGIGAYLPLKDSATGELLGVFSVSLSLLEMNGFLQRLPLSPSSVIVITDAQGLLVASSTSESPFQLVNPGKPPQLKRITPPESPHPIIAQFSGTLDSSCTLDRTCVVKMVGDRHFVLQRRYQNPQHPDLNWTISIIIPERDFMAEISENRRQTVVLCSIALLISLLFAVITTRWIIQPLQELDEQVQKWSHGELPPLSSPEGFGVIRTLTQSFGKLGLQLAETLTALQTSEQKFSILLDSVPLGVSVFDGQGQLILINQTGEQILGQGKADVPLDQLSQQYRLYRAGTDEWYPAQKIPVYLALQGKTVHVEDMELERDGQRVALDILTVPVQDPKTGEVLYVINAFQDITDRKQADQLLHNYNQTLSQAVQERTHQLTTSEQRYRLLTENLADLISLHGPDRRFHYLSPIFYCMTGYHPADYLGGDPKDLIHPQDLPAATEAWKRVQKTNRSVTFTGRVQHRNGHYVWVESKLQPLRDRTTGQLEEIIIISRDVSDRILADQKLRESEARFRSAFEDAGIGMAITRLDGQVLRANPPLCQILGYSERELLQMNFADYSHPEDLAQEYPLLEQLERGKIQTYQLEKRYFCRQGRVIWVLVSVSLVRNDQQVPLYHLVQIQNINALKTAQLELTRAKEAAEAANQAKSTFLASMSHELRTPLNAILGYPQLLINSPHLSPQEREFIQIIERSGNYLLSLINQVLELSKIEAGSSTLNLQACDVKALLDDIKQMLKIQAEAKGLLLQFHLAPNLPACVKTDEVKLRQVLINLLGNALKFTQQGQVTLSVTVTHTTPPRLNFAVTDTGLGIAPDTQQKLFQAFVQGDQTPGFQEGTGLGLAISQKFVKLLGGTITVESEPGKGSCFQFEINAESLTCPTLPPESLSPLTSLAPTETTYRILVVDDNRVNRQLLVAMLKPLGLEVQEAEDGYEAIALWQSWQPHLVFMDLQMPKLDGYGAIAQMQTLPHSPTAKIIAVTASAFEEDKTMALQAGFHAFIRKPFQKQQIINMLQHQLNLEFLPPTPPTPPPPPLLTPILLAQVPRDWVLDLKEALYSGDINLMKHLTNTLQEDYPDTAQAIHHLIDDFQFQQLLDTIDITLDPP